MANKTITIKTRYTHQKAKPTIFSKDNSKSVSRTQQHFREEANINSIMDRYNKSGLLTDPAKVATIMPKFGDFTNISDFQTMQNRIVEVKNYFMSLPADIRRRFDNNPNSLLTWMSDPENTKEARDLGLIGRDLSNVRYTKELEDGSIVDITDEVIQNRGLFVNGKRVNRDGTLYVEVKENPVVPTNETPSEEGGNS